MMCFTWGLKLNLEVKKMQLSMFKIEPSTATSSQLFPLLTSSLSANVFFTSHFFSLLLSICFSCEFLNLKYLSRNTLPFSLIPSLALLSLVLLWWETHRVFFFSRLWLLFLFPMWVSSLLSLSPSLFIRHPCHCFDSWLSNSHGSSWVSSRDGEAGQLFRF